MDNRIIRLLITSSLILLGMGISCRKQDSPEPQASVYYEELDEEIPAGELEEPSQTEPLDTELKEFEYSWIDSEGMPDIVIIVDDFGNSGALVEEFAKLPEEVVFAVLPDLSHTEQTGEIASQYGHEVLIHIPMQAVSSNVNPGEKYISVDSTDEEISSMLDDFYAQLPMAIGANNHMGSAVTANRQVMTSVLSGLHSRDLFFMDSFTTGKSVATYLARTLGYPALKRDIFLDVPDVSDETLAGKISSLAKYKGRREPVIIITHCHNRKKLDSLRKFITQIQSMGLNLIKLSEARNIAT
ncbi:MAG: divergent polysaccharide deacetylase family protein [Candidatus Syntrophosphaera sp.]